MRRLRAWVLVVVSGVLAQAACGRTSLDGTSPAKACADYLQAAAAFGAACYGEPPALTSGQAREIQVCGLYASAPGAGWTVAALEDNADAINGAVAQSTCVLPANVVVGGPPLPPSPGALPFGATCGEDAQCASTWCEGGGLHQPNDGAVYSYACGTCGTPPTIGGPCEIIGALARCPYGSFCVFDDGTGTYTCKGPLPPSDVGGSCAGALGCKGGLFCTGAGPTCEPLPPGSCGVSTDCDPPLVCGPPYTAAGTGVCENGVPVGGSCETTPCVRSAGCDPASNRCVPFRFVGAGAACDGLSNFCQGAPCIDPATNNPTTGDGVCMTVIPDGQPCTFLMTAATCEPSSNCVGGTCQLFDPSTCP